MMKPLLILVSLFGLMAGPGYLGYCSLISGAAHESVNLYEADVVSASVKGVKVTHSKGGEWNNAVSLELSPDLNPINLSLSCRYVKPASRREVRSAFAVKLKSDDKTIWEQDVSEKRKRFLVNLLFDHFQDMLCPFSRQSLFQKRAGVRQPALLRVLPRESHVVKLFDDCAAHVDIDDVELGNLAGQILNDLMIQLLENRRRGFRAQ